MVVSSGTVAFVLLAFAAGGTLLLALALYYHWVRYGVGIIGTFIVMVSYAIGTAVLLISALGVFAQL